ncbi:hypothetical protein OIU77_016200 [Salix suchowensis]|uniref:Uncharacterized protein n=1 Tax=Salix suchowensis TaxID=1278906 RepID=A0ABQ8ZJP3_9ROSI|nr:hypothetical protein OIU77_016200 [Salix suchowensis]
MQLKITSFPTSAPEKNSFSKPPTSRKDDTSHSRYHHIPLCLHTWNLHHYLHSHLQGQCHSYFHSHHQNHRRHCRRHIRHNSHPGHHRPPPPKS